LPKQHVVIGTVVEINDAVVQRAAIRPAAIASRVGGVASAIVCDGVSAAAVVFAPEYGNEDEHQV
jgi:hypothetical protein